MNMKNKKLTMDNRAYLQVELFGKDMLNKV